MTNRRDQARVVEPLHADQPGPVLGAASRDVGWRSGRSVPGAHQHVRVPGPGLAVQVDGVVHRDAGLLERSDQRRIRSRAASTDDHL